MQKIILRACTIAKSFKLCGYKGPKKPQPIKEIFHQFAEYKFYLKTPARQDQDIK